MNTPAYRQAYMANLNAQANRCQSALTQYVNNGGTPPPSYVQAKGTKVITRK